MSNVKPLMSIIMNCHNGEKYLYQSIKSIISQTYINWELIFWDNNSSDKSKEIVNKFKDERIKYYVSNNFKKLYDARNLAINKASGQYISFIDTDDLWENDKIEKQINFFLENKDFEIVYSNYFILDEKKSKKFTKFKKKLNSGMINNDLIKNYTVGLVTVSLKKEIFEEYSFNNNFDIIGDFDLIIRLSEKKKIGYIHDTLATYRLHDSNLSKNKFSTYINELQTWIRYNKDKLKEKSNLKYISYFLIKLRIKKFLKIFSKKLGM